MEIVEVKRKEEPDDWHLIPPPHMKLHTKDVRGENDFGVL